MQNKRRVSRKVQLDEITKSDILRLSQQLQMELSFTNKTNGYAQATFGDLTKTFGVVTEELLEHCPGIAGVPLANVFCPKHIPKPKYEYQDFPWGVIYAPASTPHPNRWMCHTRSWEISLNTP